MPFPLINFRSYVLIMSLKFNKIAILGVGLIGGSFARVCKKNSVAKSIMGFGRGEANLQKAVELGVIDEYSLDLKQAVSEADFILLSVPVGTITPMVKKIIPFLKEDCILSDVGSVKGSLVEEIESILPKGIRFVGAHPIAGTENSGAEASFVELFEGSKCILTPTEKTDSEAINKVKELWELTGSEVNIMEAAKHDEIMAAVSHLPHIAAYAITSFIFNLKQEWPEILSYSAGGFRDFTRIASSHPAMWRDICEHNKDALIRMIEHYESSIGRFKSLIKEDNWSELEKTMSESKNLRDNFYRSN